MTLNLAQIETEEETEQDREGWTALDYVNQYIDKDLMKLIVYFSNAAALASIGTTTVDEMYHFFGASILMFCVLYPQIRMYWSSALRFQLFFKLRQSIQVVIDDDTPEDLRGCDKFWTVRPFLDRILKGWGLRHNPSAFLLMSR